MLIRAPLQRIDSAQCLVAQRGGFLRAHPAQHKAGSVSVPCWIAGKLPRFGREGGALGQGPRMRASLTAQVFNRIRRNAAGVSTCQPHATPRIAMVRLWEREDGAGNPAHNLWPAVGSLGPTDAAARAGLGAERIAAGNRVSILQQKSSGDRHVADDASRFH